MNKRTKRKKYGGMRSQFYPQQREKVKEQTKRKEQRRKEDELNETARTRFDELEKDRLKLENIWSTIDRLEELDNDDDSDYEEFVDARNNYEFEDSDDEFEDAHQYFNTDEPIDIDTLSNTMGSLSLEPNEPEQRTLQSYKSDLNFKPRLIVICLNDELCNILPKKCSAMGYSFADTCIVFKYTIKDYQQKLKIIDIYSLSSGELEKWTTYKFQHLYKNEIIENANNKFFYPEFDNMVSKYINPGTAYINNNLLIISSEDSKKPVTILMDFTDIIDNNDILPDILYPEVTMYRCSMKDISDNISNNITDCKGDSPCYSPEKCRTSDNLDRLEIEYNNFQLGGRRRRRKTIRKKIFNYL